MGYSNLPLKKIWRQTAKIDELIMRDIVEKTALCVSVILCPKYSDMNGRDLNFFVLNTSIFYGHLICEMCKKVGNFKSVCVYNWSILWVTKRSIFGLCTQLFLCVLLFRRDQKLFDFFLSFSSGKKIHSDFTLWIYRIKWNRGSRCRTFGILIIKKN